MTNYIIEGNDIDFFAEINKANNIINKDQDSHCLLTGEKLDYNYVTLPCNHSFNYIPLYNEIIQQKEVKSYISGDSIRLCTYQIKCPYCRNVSNKLLPHIPLPSCKRRIVGVNSPDIYTMKGKTCTILCKSGKNRGTVCGKTAYEDCEGIICNYHRKYLNRNIKTNTIVNTNNQSESLYKHTVVELRNMLRQYNLKVSGRKTEIICRLNNYLSKLPSSI